MLRIAIVTLALFGWFVLSNHCALGRVAQQAQVKKEHACCHNGTSQPAKEPMPGGQGIQCCKSLNAVVPDAAKLGELPAPLLVGAAIAWVETLHLANSAVLVSAADTGPPPRAETFSELVLHRSLRSHAPPLLA